MGSFLLVAPPRGHHYKLHLGHGFIQAYVIFQDDRLKAVKCSRFWLRFCWLLLIIFGLKVYRDYSGFLTILYALAVVLYRGVSMYFVHCFAVELEFAELLDPNPSNATGPSLAHYNVRPGSSGEVSGEFKEAPVYEQPMAVFDVHRV
ncbi:unnamed protein product [Allacma fusca]|uniref:Uncharacterized protein n=1 Tax=Allacma fusca TaxID=39272 RepID=A0A8J2JBW6_9HEXA|nr:unnamed protein product [Allacma fusca]